MRNSQQGFTLVEVLVAFTILVASVSVAVVIFGNGLRAAGVSDDYARAIAVAENRLAELQVADALVPGESGGVAAEDMLWNIRIAPGFLGETGAEGKPDFFRIAVTVLWGGEEAPRSFTLHSLLVPQARQASLEEEETGETSDGEETGADEESGGDDAGTDEGDEE